MLEVTRGESLSVRVRAVTPGGGVVRPGDGTSVTVFAWPPGASRGSAPFAGVSCSFDGSRDWQGLLDTRAWPPGQWSLRARVTVPGASYPGGVAAAGHAVTGEDNVLLLVRA